MCPDRELLSAYVDGEVPEPWNERLARHLASCDSCAKAAEKYRELSRRIKTADFASEGLDESAVLGRLGERLDEELAGLEPAGRGRGPGGRGPGASRFRRSEVWRRRVALPLPAAAAAAIIVVALLVLSVLGLSSPGRGAPAPALAAAPSESAIQATATAAAELPPAAAQSANMDELLRYLDSKNGEVTVTIRLPTGSSFERLGAPVLQVAGPPDSTQKDGAR